MVCMSAAAIFLPFFFLLWGGVLLEDGSVASLWINMEGWVGVDNGMVDKYAHVYTHIHTYRYMNMLTKSIV